MERILRNYIKEEEEIKILLENLISSFSKRTTLKYSINDKTYLILSKDERKVSHLRRYKDTPLPLLSNLEEFSNSPGEWNESLLEYGLKSRLKLKDSESSEVGTKIHVAFNQTLNSQGNQYLRRQYERLRVLRKQLKIRAYWKLAWTLMSKSLSFRIACLNSWQSRWYKTYSFTELQRMFKSLNKILNLTERTTQIYNVWIESPKGKWRQLGVPKKAWRLYLHMLNIFITFIYEPHLPSENYEGFIYNRGCKSWWESVIWSNLLNRYSCLIEVDLSSAFPNLNRETLRKSLISDGLIPKSYINLILTHLNSPLKESTWFPTFETYVENRQNQAWRQGNRSVHMGLGISPILFVICQNWVLNQIPVQNSELTYKWYADDGSFYFNIKGLITLIKSQGKNPLWILNELLRGRNVLLSLLNNLPLFKESGMILCSRKSRLIRLFGIWIHPYISLGLKLSTPSSILTQLYKKFYGQKPPLELSGWTRGRGENPIKGKAGTLKSRTPLKFPHQNKKDVLDYNQMTSKYRNYFGLLLSKLYTNPGNSSINSSRGPIKKNSILFTLQRSLKRKSNRKLGLNLNTYNSGSKLTELLLKINNSISIDPKWSQLYPNIERELKLPWKPIVNNIEEIEISNPLIPRRNKDDYFKKFSELRLNSLELATLKKRYLEQPDRNGSREKPKPSQKG